MIRLVSNKGEEKLIGVSMPPKDSAFSGSLTNEALVKRLERLRARYENRLSQGYCCFFFSSGLELTFGSQKAAVDLRLITEILKSDRDVKDKFDLLERMDFLSPGVEKSVQKLLSNFKSSDKLEQRIANLITEMRVNPRELEDIPAESAQKKQRRIMEENLRKAQEEKRQQEKDAKR
jgi:hypothetical protein